MFNVDSLYQGIIDRFRIYFNEIRGTTTLPRQLNVHSPRRVIPEFSVIVLIFVGKHGAVERAGRLAYDIYCYLCSSRWATENIRDDDGIPSRTYWK